MGTPSPHPDPVFRVFGHPQTPGRGSQTPPAGPPFSTPPDPESDPQPAEKSGFPVDSQTPALPDTPDPRPRPPAGGPWDRFPAPTPRFRDVGVLVGRVPKFKRVWVAGRVSRGTSGSGSHVCVSSVGPGRWRSRNLVADKIGPTFVSPPANFQPIPHTFL